MRQILYVHSFSQFEILSNKDSPDARRGAARAVATAMAEAVNFIFLSIEQSNSDGRQTNGR
jgi:hypothetical protein